MRSTPVKHLPPVLLPLPIVQPHAQPTAGRGLLLQALGVRQEAGEPLGQAALARWRVWKAMVPRPPQPPLGTALPGRGAPNAPPGMEPLKNSPGAEALGLLVTPPNGARRGTL